MKRTRARGSEESGYALLMVFVLAAVVAITLYMEMPRVAFESQRTKEQLLIDRGEQYKRAIQIFYRKNKRFPTTMEELEKFQEIRFLRQRYKDPMTGQDEWRVIHVGPGGQLTDSLVQKQQNPLGQNGSNGMQAGQQGSSGQSNPGFNSSFGSQPGSTGQANGSGQPPVQYNANGMPVGGAEADSTGGAPSGINMAIARRHSDQMNLGLAQPGAVNPNGDPNQPQDPNQPLDPNQIQNSGQPNLAQPNAVQPMPGLPQYPGQVYPGQPQPGQPQPGQPQLGQPQPGQPGYQPGQATGPQVYNPNQPYNTNQANTGVPQPGQFNNGGNSFSNGSAFNNGNNNNGNNPPNNGAAGGNPALNAIQNSLFAPRPQGSFGSSSLSGNSPGGGLGIAGVATKYKGPSIKVVNERKKYQEWEFVYDMRKDKTLIGAAALNQLQNPPGSTPGFSGFGGNQNPNGSSSGNNGGSSFGGGSPSQPQPQPPQQQPQQPQQQQQ